MQIPGTFLAEMDNMGTSCKTEPFILCFNTTSKILYSASTQPQKYYTLFQQNLKNIFSSFLCFFFWTNLVSCMIFSCYALILMYSRVPKLIPTLKTIHFLFFNLSEFTKVINLYGKSLCFKIIHAQYKRILRYLSFDI
jgi:hypothetical protein